MTREEKENQAVAAEMERTTEGKKRREKKVTVL